MGGFAGVRRKSNWQIVSMARIQNRVAGVASLPVPHKNLARKVDKKAGNTLAISW